jgi:hypothetical protein
MKPKKFTEKQIEDAADELLAELLEIIAEEQPISEEELAAFRRGSQGLGPEFEALAQKRLKPEQIQQILAKARTSEASESPSVKLVVKRLRERKTASQEGESSPTWEPSAVSSPLNVSKADVGGTSMLAALAEELTALLRESFARAFSQSPMEASDEEKPIIQIRLQNGQLEVRVYAEINGDFTLLVESENLELAGKRFIIEFVKTATPWVALLQVDDRRVFGEVTIPREIAPTDFRGLTVRLTEAV